MLLLLRVAKNMDTKSTNIKWEKSFQHFEYFLFSFGWIAWLLSFEHCQAWAKTMTDRSIQGTKMTPYCEQVAIWMTSFWFCTLVWHSGIIVLLLKHYNTQSKSQFYMTSPCMAYKDESKCWDWRKYKGAVSEQMEIVQSSQVSLSNAITVLNLDRRHFLTAQKT